MGVPAVTEAERRDLLEDMENGYATRSPIMTSQLPPAKQNDLLVERTLADAMCDRSLHNAHLVALKAPSCRKELISLASDFSAEVLHVVRVLERRTWRILRVGSRVSSGADVRISEDSARIGRWRSLDPESQIRPADAGVGRGRS